MTHRLHISVAANGASRSSGSGAVLLLLTLLALATGCSSLDLNTELPTVLTAENTGAFAPRPAIPDPVALHQLTPDQEKAFLAYMNNPRFTGLNPEMRLYQYLKQVTKGFAYDSATLDATTTLASNSGNCMSLAILTTALADLAGIETGHQLMDDIPVYEFNATVIKKGVHIRTKLFENNTDHSMSIFTRPGMIIDYFPTNRERFISNINRPVYLAMIYQNLAAEALEQGDLNTAYWTALEALRHVPLHAAAINTLAITKRRTGDPQAADTIYRFGITHADEKLSLMKNYVLLLTENGREREARHIQQQLDTMEDPSPFHWYQLARTTFDKGEYREAIRFYDKSLVLAPYLHEAWLGIAQANFALGRLEQTRNALQAAYQEAEKVSTRNLYQAKLVSLNGSFSH